MLSNLSASRQNGGEIDDFADIVKLSLPSEYYCILIQFFQKFAAIGPVDNNLSLAKGKA